MIPLPVVLYPYAKEHYPKANADDWVVLGLFFLGGAVFFWLVHNLPCRLQSFIHMRCITSTFDYTSLVLVPLLLAAFRQECGTRSLCD